MFTDTSNYSVSNNVVLNNAVSNNAVSYNVVSNDDVLNIDVSTDVKNQDEVSKRTVCFDNTEGRIDTFSRHNISQKKCYMK